MMKREKNIMRILKNTKKTDFEAYDLKEELNDDMDDFDVDVDSMSTSVTFTTTSNPQPTPNPNTFTCLHEKINASSSKNSSIIVADRQMLNHAISNSFTNLSLYCTSNIDDFSELFSIPKYNGTFNQSLYTWDTQSVKSMNSMFSGQSDFNQDISSWDVSSVTKMIGMFWKASSFNQDISGWDVQ